MNWKNRSVLVTGAGGFIGSHLTEQLLRRGASVRALVRYNSRNDWGFLEEIGPELRKRLDVWSGDVADPHFMLNAVEGRDVVFHLAALIAIPYSYIAPSIYAATNVTGTLNVLEACRRQRVKRVVHTSTSEVYGTACYTPIDEKHPLQGQSPYSASKIGADKLAESYFRSFGLPVVTVRPFNTFGPRQSARAVIPTIITQLLSGAKKLSLGSLNPVRDFNFVLDTVEGFIAAGGAPRVEGEVINVGSGR
ncbi:MAG TPA: GDP-mannose 4,6-dehydratase, partial [Elusimicrobiota bacterium]|nr:GDP-mannose 4,6-dehydratase [Elusimicrobiota bacterium]